MRRVVAAAVFLLCDAAFVGGVAQPLYRRTLERSVLRRPWQPRRARAVAMAALCWAVLLLGLQVFVVDGAAWSARGQLRAAVFGLVVYGTYAATNAAVFAPDWPLHLALADALWGVLVYGLAYASALLVP